MHRAALATYELQLPGHRQTPRVTLEYRNTNIDSGYMQ
ncbi:hypothetical protein Bcep1808_7667 (plasmid) [Burkholderia vietnamiensis G4]|uniref:Uncharacterized protein n=1 Tax=Burkholderia vietnamiensis (strain G4 / LMG 22486) TaxID=269482 RepID=A4JW84_BURVG|nr:hypothetical protein Bcep1808_7667 [Burkholderia vietnamiensis G4]